MADAREVNDALVQVARAIQRGTLPLELNVRNNAGIGLELWPGPMMSQDEAREQERKILLWLQRNWPTTGMTMQRIERSWSSQARRRPKQWWDRRTWQSSNDPRHAAVVTFSYSVPHLCRDWAACYRGPDWFVRWSCGACGKPLTKTKAKEMGLPT